MNAASRCPQCAGTLTRASQTGCEWCGASLNGVGRQASADAPRTAPASPASDELADRERLEATLASLQQQLASTGKRASGAGCVFFVLLMAALLAVFMLFFFGLWSTSVVSEPNLAPVGPEGPTDR
jgi:hypothetical protein